MKYAFFFFIVFFLSLHPDASAQLPNGSIAPNWTLTDIEGNTYTLYDYLDQGKMVVLEFGETRCTPCWEYMNSGELEAFWDQHGPAGLDDAMVFFIESSWETDMDDLLGLTQYSNGNWVAACPFPLIDLAPGNTTASVDYGVYYFPTLYAVCHDRTVYEFGSVPTQDWIDFLESCSMEVEVADMEEAICAGDGSVTVEPAGGFSPYTYQWDNGATVPTISGLISGAYQVSITEGNGKISTLEVLVPGATEPLALSDDVESTLCFGSADGNIFIDVEGGIPGYDYAWNTGITTENILNVTSGTYSVTVTDNLGCTMDQTFYISQPALLAVNAMTTPVSCDQPDGTITLSISGGVGGNTISTSAGTIIGNQIVGLSAGLISIAVEDGNGCTWSDDVLIPYIDYPVVSFTGGGDINCIQTTSTISAFATGGYNEFDFQWTTVDGHIISNPLSSVITVDAPGSYLLHVTDLTSGCETNATSVVASGVIIPNVDAGTGIPIDCEHPQVTLTGNGDVQNIIIWSTAGGSIVSGANTYQPVVDAPGTYVIHVVHPATNCTNQDSVLITNESVPPAASFQYQTSGLTIAGADHSTGSNLAGWNWTFGDGLSSIEQNPVHTYTDSGTYEVCLSVQNGCGVSQLCQSIQVIFTVSAITVDAVITHVYCFGDRTGGINLSVSGGSGTYTYNWTGPDTTYTTSSIGILPAGMYQLIVTDDEGNNFIGSYQVNQPPAIVLETLVTDPLCHGDANGYILITVTGGVGPPYSYTWSGNWNGIGLFGGHYVITVTDPNGCTAVKDAILVDPAPIAVDSILVTDASGPDENDGAISLAVLGGTPPYVVSWSNGASGTSIIGLIPGAYEYVITDANDCQYISPEPLQVTFTSATNEVDKDAKINIMPNPSSGEVIIRWNDMPSGNMSLTLLNINGKILDVQEIHSEKGTWDLTSNDLQEGMYIILFKQDEEVFPYKLVVL
ncbi:MAG TPA: PKD domain-containing protein [Saprospiraceae bacterium]|nr:PKD domain-containing protein [Saprospiraceae bacterium]